MSFTAVVKDELSRTQEHNTEEMRALLSALVRVNGTLLVRGSGQYSIRVSTETGAVARLIIKLSRVLYNLETQLTVRRSVLHKTRNYLIEIPQQDRLVESLLDLGILNNQQGLTSGIEARLIQTIQEKKAFVKGAFLAGGFIADPRQNFHLEICVSSQPLAHDLMQVLNDFDIHSKLNVRRTTYVLYIKNYSEIISFLNVLNVTKTVDTFRKVRVLKSVKNEVNRKVNAEIANQARSISAASAQVNLIDEASRLIGLDKLPQALREFCMLRLTYPELSLRDLGEKCDPVLSKSALNHRIRRLETLVEQARH